MCIYVQYICYKNELLTHSRIWRRPKLERVDRYKGILGKKLRVKGNKKFLGDATFAPDW